jgi:hypothetical protein
LPFWRRISKGRISFDAGRRSIARGPFISPAARAFLEFMPMVSSIIRPVVLCLPLALVMLPGFAARAQQPKLEMHRTAVDSKDPSG